MENIKYGLMVLIIGMVVVLVTLTGLAFIMGIMKKLFYKEQKASKANIVKEEPMIEIVEQKDDIVAAISAALAFYLGKSPVNFNVISINRIGKSNWRETGKQELLQANITNKM